MRPSLSRNWSTDTTLTSTIRDWTHTADSMTLRASSTSCTSSSADFPFQAQNECAYVSSSHMSKVLIFSMQSSSEDNMHRLQIEHKLTNKSLSAEVLMSRPRFRTRYLDLADSRGALRPCICGFTEKAQVTKSHRRTMSDVVKTETSLNYGIITRATKPQVH